MVTSQRHFLDAQGVLGHSQGFRGPAPSVLDQRWHEPILYPGQIHRLGAEPTGGALMEVGGELQRAPVVPSRQAIVDGSRLSFDTPAGPWTATGDASGHEKAEGVWRDQANELPPARSS